MIKLGYFYHGNKKILEDIKTYDPIIIIENEEYIKELLPYNLTIKILKYDNECYDILISDTNEFSKICALKRVVIGDFKEHKSKVIYLDKFDLDKIIEKPQKANIKFSVIVPNYNNANWINKTIESVINQTYQDWEMYIIDDMSTDNSIDVIKKYKDKRITLIENKIKLYNGGSRNVGILKAKESNYNGYLIFIDSDDWLANDNVLSNLNGFIEDEDLITLDYQYYMSNEIKKAGKHSYRNKDELFMTIGSMCAVWCKCFKVSVAPLFEFNTLMEDRNYHYRLVNRIKSYSNYGQVTHTWNKMNTKSITSEKYQKYNGELQSPIEWNNCAYRHIAGMLDLLNELDNPLYITYINNKIETCKEKIDRGIYQQI